MVGTKKWNKKRSLKAEQFFRLSESLETGFGAA